MKEINLRGVKESLSDKEMMQVKGGADGGESGLDDKDHNCPTLDSCGPDGVGGGEGSHSLKCYNSTTSCWVSACPGSTADAQAMCNTPACGGGYGSFISCA